MNTPQPDPIDQLRGILATQTRYLDLVIHRLSDFHGRSPDDQNVLRVTLLMAQGLGVTIHSALKLTAERDMAIPDCFGLARSGFELAVNTCFIVAEGVDAARRADNHAMQKTYRDMHRSGEIGGVRFEVSRNEQPASASGPGLDEALEQFSRKGKELTAWTPVNISDRIKAVASVDSSAAISLSGAASAIFRHASELLHGTVLRSPFLLVRWSRGSANQGGICFPLAGALHNRIHSLVLCIECRGPSPRAEVTESQTSTGTAGDLARSASCAR